VKATIEKRSREFELRITPESKSEQRLCEQLHHAMRETDVYLLIAGINPKSSEIMLRTFQKKG
jgi:hypothetical protein